MHYDLQLHLELISDTDHKIVFRLTTTNRSEANLLIPHHKITDLRFGNKTTKMEAEWFCTSFVRSNDIPGYVLAAGESKNRLFEVRPQAAPASAELDLHEYQRFCIDLPASDYLVWYKFCVDDNYFEPDTGHRLKSLQKKADELDAIVWVGNVVSNRLHLVRKT